MHARRLREFDRATDALIFGEVEPGVDAAVLRHRTGCRRDRTRPDKGSGSAGSPRTPRTVHVSGSTARVGLAAYERGRTELRHPFTLVGVPVRRDVLRPIAPGRRQAVTMITPPAAARTHPQRASPKPFCPGRHEQPRCKRRFHRPGNLAWPPARCHTRGTERPAYLPRGANLADHRLAYGDVTPGGGRV